MLRNALSLRNDDTNRLAPNWGLSAVSDQSSFEDGPDTTGRVATHGKHEVDLSLIRCAYWLLIQSYSKRSTFPQAIHLR